MVNRKGLTTHDLLEVLAEESIVDLDSRYLRHRFDGIGKENVKNNYITPLFTGLYRLDDGVIVVTSGVWEKERTRVYESLYRGSETTDGAIRLSESVLENTTHYGRG